MVGVVLARRVAQVVAGPVRVAVVEPADAPRRDGPRRGAAEPRERRARGGGQAQVQAKVYMRPRPHRGASSGASMWPLSEVQARSAASELSKARRSLLLRWNSETSCRLIKGNYILPVRNT